MPYSVFSVTVLAALVSLPLLCDSTFLDSKHVHIKIHVPYMIKKETPSKSHIKPHHIKSSSGLGVKTSGFPVFKSHDKLPSFSQHPLNFGKHKPVGDIKSAQTSAILKGYIDGGVFYGNVASGSLKGLVTSGSESFKGLAITSGNQGGGVFSSSGDVPKGNAGHVLGGAGSSYESSSFGTFSGSQGRGVPSKIIGGSSGQFIPSVQIQSSKEITHQEQVTGNGNTAVYGPAEEVRSTPVNHAQGHHGSVKEETYFRNNAGLPAFNGAAAEIAEPVNLKDQGYEAYNPNYGKENLVQEGYTGEGNANVFVTPPTEESYGNYAQKHPVYQSGNNGEFTPHYDDSTKNSVQGNYGTIPYQEYNSGGQDDKVNSNNEISKENLPVIHNEDISHMLDLGVFNGEYSYDGGEKVNYESVSSYNENQNQGVNNHDQSGIQQPALTYSSGSQYYPSQSYESDVNYNSVPNYIKEVIMKEENGYHNDHGISQLHPETNYNNCVDSYGNPANSCTDVDSGTTGSLVETREVQHMVNTPINTGNSQNEESFGGYYYGDGVDLYSGKSSTMR